MIDDDDELEIKAAAAGGPKNDCHWLDWLLAALAGLFVFVLMQIWAFPGVLPEAYPQIAVAAGIRPAAMVCPSLWERLMGGMLTWGSLTAGINFLRVLGPVISAVSVAFVFLIFRRIIALIGHLRLQYSPQRYWIVRLASFLGAICFGCSDPVWRVGQAFTTTTLFVCLSILAIYCFFTFMCTGRLVTSYLALFILGVLSAETPIGILLLLTLLGMFLLGIRGVLDMDVAVINPFLAQVSKWYMTFLFLLGFLGTVVLNCLFFVDTKGLTALGLLTSDLPITYVIHLWRNLLNIASPMGWILSSGIIILPAALTTGLLSRAIDEEQFLPYHVGALYWITGLVAFTQVAGMNALWLWSWLPPSLFTVSPYLKCLLMFAASLTVTFALVTLGVDAFCRNHRRLAIQMYAEMSLAEADDQLLASNHFIMMMRRVGLVVVPLIVLGCTVPGRRLPELRTALAILHDYVGEVIRETGNGAVLFTDGAFDNILEVQSACRGRKLKTLSLLADNAPYNVYLRTQGVTDAEDVLTLQSGVAATLRTWIKDKPERLKDSAVQLGFEVWQHEALRVPPCSGVLCRPAGMSEEERVRGIKAAINLVRRTLKLSETHGLGKSLGPSVNRLMLLMQWRLSRLMRMRADEADKAGRVDEALTESKLADELDLRNPAVRAIRENVARVRQMVTYQMTPREGLQLALARADFNLAKKYAQVILADNADDADANFGMGMGYLVQQQWARAEEYLTRALKCKAEEPAVYNNLAIVQLKMKRYDEAYTYAQKAFALAPESADIADTLRQVETVRAAEAEQKKTSK